MVIISDLDTDEIWMFPDDAWKARFQPDVEMGVSSSQPASNGRADAAAAAAAAPAGARNKTSKGQAAGPSRAAAAAAARRASGNQAASNGWAQAATASAATGTSNSQPSAAAAAMGAWDSQPGSNGQYPAAAAANGAWGGQPACSSQPQAPAAGMEACGSHPAPNLSSFAVNRVLDICKLHYTRVSVEKFCQLFGQPTPEHLWGPHFWTGMNEFLANEYRHKHKLDGCHPCNFTVPQEYKKDIVTRPRTAVASSALEVPAFAALTWGATETFTVASWTMLMEDSKPWTCVHSSWLRFADEDLHEV